MNTRVFQDGRTLGRVAAELASSRIHAALETRGEASIILATGSSQFATLEALTAMEGIDWSRVTMFHLDEYIGLSLTHPASFRGYLKKRFIDRVPGLKETHLIDGEAVDPRAECRRLGALISARPIDVCLAGIGENGHLAFNDPPADFETSEPYIIVDLDEACRRQQAGEGWFATFEDVPARAISMSIRQMMKSSTLVLSVPDQRKAKAVRDAVDGPLTNACPASVIRQHPDCHLLMDTESASLLSITS